MAVPSPFVLLDDARPGGAGARLYEHPVEIVRADTVDQVAAALAAVRAGVARGLDAAGFLAYEAAPAFERALARSMAAEDPLLWFGLFAGYADISGAALDMFLGDPAGAWIGAPRPHLEPHDHADRVATLQTLIESGDIYQANLTYRADVPIAGGPLAIYARLRGGTGAGHGAVIATGDRTILSFSPELFFALTRGQLLCRPMKGTARRGATPAEDAQAVADLAADAKQRAENLMIVDLMRNDLSRVAVAGSVAVPRLFAVETYPTVHQMVSDVTATLAPGNDAVDVLAALFPCGSITGAPKISAMHSIASVEQGMAPRGVYTGAIGRFDARGDAAFSVAIRTLTVAAGAAVARFGVGGGIVADSVAAAEWDETLAKGAFLGRGARAFDLIETMAFDPVSGVARLDRHLERLSVSAHHFGFAFDRHSARNELQAATFRLGAPARVRLLLGRSGAIAIEVQPLGAPLPAPVPVAIVPLPVAPDDFRLRHKTTDRGFYDDARAAAGTAEVVFVDPQGFVTEGSFTSVFAVKAGRLVTPSLDRGLLPGILRADMIATGQAIAGELSIADLASGFFIGNALRGLMPAFVARPEVAPQ